MVTQSDMGATQMTASFPTLTRRNQGEEFSKVLILILPCDGDFFLSKISQKKPKALPMGSFYFATGYKKSPDVDFSRLQVWSVRPDGLTSVLQNRILPLLPGPF